MTGEAAPGRNDGKAPLYRRCAVKLALQLLLFLVLAILSWSALAQAPASTSEPDVRPLLRAADREIDAGHLRKAAELHRQAFLLTRNWKHAWNVARLLDADGDLGGARKSYEEARQVAPDAETLARIQVAVVALELKMLANGYGRLTVRVTPANAAVHVDGAFVAPVDGVASLVLRPGAHRLQVLHAAHAEIDEMVTLGAGQDLRLDRALRAKVPPVVAPDSPPVAARVPMVTPKVEPEPSSWLHVAAWGVGAGGAAGLGVGTWWLLSGQADRTTAKSAPIHSLSAAESTDADLTTANARMTRGWVVAGAGLAAVGVAAWLVLRPQSARTVSPGTAALPAVAVTPLPGGAALSAAVAF